MRKERGPWMANTCAARSTDGGQSTDDEYVTAAVGAAVVSKEDNTGGRGRHSRFPRYGSEWWYCEWPCHGTCLGSY